MGTSQQQLHQGTAQGNVVYCKHYLAGMENVFRIPSKKGGKRNEDTITSLNYIHHVFTSAVKWLISENLNEAIITVAVFSCAISDPVILWLDNVYPNHTIILWI